MLPCWWIAILQWSQYYLQSCLFFREIIFLILALGLTAKMKRFCIKHIHFFRNNATVKYVSLKFCDFAGVKNTHTQTHAHSKKVMTKKYDGIWLYLRVWLRVVICDSQFVIHNKRIWISTTKFFVVMNFFGLM